MPSAGPFEKMACRDMRLRVLFDLHARGRMPSPMKHALLPALLLAVLPLNAAPVPKIDVSRLPQQSRVIGDVVVPVPSEIFNVLDKLQKPRWADVLRPMKGVAEAHGEQAQV